MANIIKEARYNFSSTDVNSNKYWYAFLYDDGTFETHWNRIGESPNKTVKTGFSEKQFDAKCKEKEKKGYRKFEPLEVASVVAKVAKDTKLEEVAKKQIEYTDPLVEKLITRLAQKNVHNIVNSGTKLTYNDTTGLFSTPLGVVTQDIVDKARDVLVDINQYMIDKKTSNDSYKRLVEDYIMYIPQDIGRQKLTPELIFPDLNAVKKQEDILSSLEASIQTVLTRPKAKSKKNDDSDLPHIFDLKLELVEDGKTIDAITKKFLSTLQNIHASSHLRPKVIYKVDIKSMRTAFEAQGEPIGNIMSLWHGTPAANCLSIMVGGLKVSPPKSARIAGKMFGNGIYFSDQASKSLNYSYGGVWDNNSRDNSCMMYLADVAMGKVLVPKSSYDGPFPRAGYDSVFGKKGTTSGLYNNEMIVYQNYQCNLTHLIEFSPGGK